MHSIISNRPISDKAICLSMIKWVIKCCDSVSFSVYTCKTGCKFVNFPLVSNCKSDLVHPSKSVAKWRIGFLDQNFQIDCCQFLFHPYSGKIFFAIICLEQRYPTVKWSARNFWEWAARKFNGLPMNFNWLPQALSIYLKILILKGEY